MVKDMENLRNFTTYELREYHWLKTCIIEANGVLIKASKYAGISRRNLGFKLRKYPDLLKSARELVPARREAKAKWKDLVDTVTPRMLDRAIEEFGYRPRFLASYFEVPIEKIRKLHEDHRVERK